MASRKKCNHFVQGDANWQTATKQATHNVTKVLRIHDSLQQPTIASKPHAVKKKDKRTTKKWGTNEKTEHYAWTVKLSVVSFKNVLHVRN